MSDSESETKTAPLDKPKLIPQVGYDPMSDPRNPLVKDPNAQLNEWFKQLPAEKVSNFVLRNDPRSPLYEGTEDEPTTLAALRKLSQVDRSKLSSLQQRKYDMQCRLVLKQLMAELRSVDSELKQE